MAADRTVIPIRVAEELEVPSLGDLPIGGYAGHITLSPTFLVLVEIRQLQPIKLELVGDAHEPFVILGRDVLNQFRIFLDGPQLAFEIGP